MAGSEAGGRFSEDEAGRSSVGDGHFSCSSVFSEFGYVAQHLEETYPGLALARCLSVCFPAAKLVQGLLVTGFLACARALSLDMTTCSSRPVGKQISLEG